MDIFNVVDPREITRDEVKVALCSKRHLDVFYSDDWRRPGIFCFMHPNAREVGSDLQVGEAVLASGSEASWWTSVAVITTTLELTPEALHYAEDRLAHMMVLEGFDLGVRIARYHLGLEPEQKSRADHVLLTSLKIFEDESRSLISHSNKASDESWLALTAPLSVKA